MKTILAFAAGVAAAALIDYMATQILAHAQLAHFEDLAHDVARVVHGRP